MKRRPEPLELVHVTVPRAAREMFEAAFTPHCHAIGVFEADDDGIAWRIEGVRDATAPIEPLETALLIAAMLSGETPTLYRAETPADGWLARVNASFPPTPIGQRFLIRGTHLPQTPSPGRHVLRIDAGLAFGSGEHGSTRGCLRALEYVSRRARIASGLDVGCGSGILAMAAASLLRIRVDAVDIDPWSVRVTSENARANRLHGRIRPLLGNGTQHREVARAAPYDLVFANILARPLTRMAAGIAAVTAPGGHIILAGLLDTQRHYVLAAYRAQHCVLITAFREGPWTTLLLTRP